MKDPGESTVYYNVLEADETGRTPKNSSFDWKKKSGFQIISQSRDRASILI